MDLVAFIDKIPLIVLSPNNPVICIASSQVCRNPGTDKHGVKGDLDDDGVPLPMRLPEPTLAFGWFFLLCFDICLL